MGHASACLGEVMGGLRTISSLGPLMGAASTEEAARRTVVKTVLSENMLSWWWIIWTSKATGKLEANICAKASVLVEEMSRKGKGRRGE